MRDHGDETRELDPVQAELPHCNLLDSLAADLVAYEGENEKGLQRVPSPVSEGPGVRGNDDDVLAGLEKPEGGVLG